MTTAHEPSDERNGRWSGVDVAALGRELNRMRRDVSDSRGERDARYIRQLIKVQRLLELGGRVALLAGGKRTTWLVGTGALSIAKILDNMEIGHNVLHGQWDWMHDPKIHSSTWEWDHASPAAQWKRAHNEVHHVYTNILGRDNDLGYGIMRVDERQPWKRRHLVQPIWNLLTACAFEYGIAIYDLDLGDRLGDKWHLSPDKKREVRTALTKARRQLTKDFALYPALAGRNWRSVVMANLTATILRNLWSHSVIMCGHFPEGVETFELTELDGNETRGAWYLRQMLGSANISGGRLLHLMSGNLSHQIEHHLFPDLPSNRYAEIAVGVQDLCKTYGLPYNARPLVPQVASAWHKVIRLSLPNGWLAETSRRNLFSQLRRLALPTSDARASGG